VYLNNNEHKYCAQSTFLDSQSRYFLKQPTIFVGNVSYKEKKFYKIGGSSVGSLSKKRVPQKKYRLVQYRMF
jgi:hypothetical protein